MAALVDPRNGETVEEFGELLGGLLLMRLLLLQLGRLGSTTVNSHFARDWCPAAHDRTRERGVEGDRDFGKALGTQRCCSSGCLGALLDLHGHARRGPTLSVSFAFVWVSGASLVIASGRGTSLTLLTAGSRAFPSRSPAASR